MPDAHVHRLADTGPIEPGGDPLGGRRLLMFNGDLEVSVCKPTEALDGFYRNGEGDEVIYVHRGGGVLRTVFGRVPFREKDYVVIPRGTTHTFELDGERAALDLLPHAGRDRDAQPLPQPLRPAARARAVLAARLPPARGARDLRRERRVPRSPCACATATRSYVLDRHPFDVVGWDGYVWPYTFNADDFEPRAGPLPPAAAGAPDLPGAELRDLHVRAADARLGPRGRAAALPPLEHPVRGGHVLRRGRLRRPQGRGRRLPSRCTPPACRTARSPARWRRRSAPSAPTSWR